MGKESVTWRTRDHAYIPGPRTHSTIRRRWERIGISPLGFSIIVHDLTPARKSQFVPCDLFEVVGIGFQGTDLVRKSCIVLLQRRDLPRESIILRLHTVVFDHAHLAENNVCKKIKSEKDAGSSKQFSIAGAVGTTIRCEGVPFMHNFAVLPGRAPGCKEKAC
jgi:hypothetical protein